MMRDMDLGVFWGNAALRFVVYSNEGCASADHLQAENDDGL